MLRQITIAATAIGASICSTPSVAQTIAVDREAMAPAAQQNEAIIVTAKMPAILPKPRSQHLVGNTELTEQRGGEQLIVTNQTLTAITQGNVLNGDFLAGDVNLSDSALSSFNGVGNILINTGAQVSLQTGMNLTINIGE
jgi:chemotaxis protein CheY-P-specific phosphatase CheC